jgi:colanic acid/amylovoran biosynthesis protein
MVIEPRRVEFVNKGAELMLYAILRKMKEAYPDAKFAMAPLKGAPYHKRAELGLYQKGHLWRKGFQFGDLAALLPQITRDRYGIVLNREVDVVLDAAGFAYGDQWRNNCLELAYYSKVWKKNGTKSILLPQAFGPYRNRENIKAMKTALDNVNLVFARDEVSYQHLVSIAGERPNLKQAPDFTNLVAGIRSENFDSNKNRSCIIPNYRMIDKTSKSDSDAYVPFMIEITRYLYQKGKSPFILVHEGANDLMLAEKIRDPVSQEISIVKETHPLRIKGIIGESELVISSRYHGLVSALSQGVPALGTGWSHKYQTLFDDYGFPEGLLDVSMPVEEIYRNIDTLVEPDKNAILKKEIGIRGQSLKNESEKMWEEVFRVLEEGNSSSIRSF